MADLEREQQLPRVTELDLLTLVMEEIEDPGHREWWRAFAKENPVLSREVIKRAYFDSYSEGLTPSEVHRNIVDNVAFAMRALRVSIERNNASTSPDTNMEIGDTSQT